MTDDRKAKKVSLLYKHLSEDLKKKLSAKKTSLGGTLEQCIASGVAIPESSVGVYATDPEAYTVFSELFLPIIADLHNVEVNSIKHPPSFWGSPTELDLTSIDTHQRIISTRARVARNLAGFPLAPGITKEDRLKVEQTVSTALKTLPQELQGTYRSLKDINDKEQEKLITGHVLYKDDDRYLEAAACYRDWPSGRGIFTNADNSVIVWVNEEDQLRIISLMNGSNLAKVYCTLSKLIQSLGQQMEFAHDPKLGYLSSCPSNLGTGLRASVHIRLPEVSKLSNFKAICKEMHLDVRGTHGEHTEAEGGVYDISNKERLGLTEWDAILHIARGIKVLLLLENSLTE